MNIIPTPTDVLHPRIIIDRILLVTGLKHDIGHIAATGSSVSPPHRENTGGLRFISGGKTELVRVEGKPKLPRGKVDDTPLDISKNFLN